LTERFAADPLVSAGAEMKVVQDMLGHSSITLTSDTYTTVLPEVARAAAEAAARMIPRQAAPRPAGHTPGSHGTIKSTNITGVGPRKTANTQVNAAS
jgi:hypothetical protein